MVAGLGATRRRGDHGAGQPHPPPFDVDAFLAELRELAGVDAGAGPAEVVEALRALLGAGAAKARKAHNLP